MVLVNVINVLKNNSFNILYRDNSKNIDISKNEGIYYSLLNLAWFLAPLITGFFFVKYSTHNMFLLSDFFILIGLILYLFLDVKETPHKTNSKPLIFKNIKEFFKRDLYKIAYFTSCGSAIINSFTYTFMAIILLESGLDKSYLGIFLGFIALPLILFEYKSGKIIEKLGFKNTFGIGYLIIIFFLLIVFFVTDVYLKMVFYLLAFIGTAFIEPTRESYFFTHTSKDDEEKFYSIFKTNSFFGLIITKIVFSIFFIFIKDSNYAFLLLIGLLSINFGFSRFIKE